MPAPERSKLFAWALYDWGNSAFSTTIMAGFFPVFFKKYWSSGVEVSESTLKLGLANSAAGLIVAVCAPVLGAIADRGGAKKRFLAAFAALGVVMSGGLYFVGQGDWLGAALLYALATVGFSGSLVFYDSLLVAVANPKDAHRASALGYSLGYLGGGVLFAVNVLMARSPASFGLVSSADGVRWSFVSVALWWALFTIPLLRWVPEPGGARMPIRRAIGSGLEQLAGTLRRARTMPEVWTFLCAYFLYIDGVDTIVRMAVDYGLSLGLPESSLIVALLITQFVGFPAALLFGRLGSSIGPKRAILIGVAVYLGVTVWGSLMRSATEFYALAVVIGLVQGGVQALSRSLYSRLIPAHEAGEFFGLFNMLGKFAAIVGPTLMGWTSVLTGNARISILSIALLFIAGAAILLRVKEPAPEQHSALPDRF